MTEQSLTEPRWAREIGRYKGVKSQFILWGNINDVYPIELDGSLTTMPLAPYLGRLLAREGYELIVRYQPLAGFEILRGTPELFQRAAGVAIDSPEQKEASLLKAAEIMENIRGRRDISTAAIVSFASRLADVCAPRDLSEFYYRAWRGMLNSVPFVAPGEKTPRHNLIIWLMDKENDPPPWYGLENPRLRSLSLPKPDPAVRERIIASCARGLPGYESASEETRAEKQALFVDQTAGMFASEIVAVAQIARRENIPFERIDDAIRGYKLGILENPWAKIPRRIYAGAEDAISARVIGQPRAVAQCVDALRRSYFNLTGAQFSRQSQRPKGVLFFAGPTGVGKTETAKSLARLIFGSPDAYLRFDMSEYAREHADQRLLGSPPGYVGYEVGGQLTNAVREKPFSLILFDEIEKAHPKILDIFLQILDDGRLTSGRGETVWFSECLIVFTSNLGAGGSDGPKPEDPYERNRELILAAIDDYFRNKLNRPEILNRIGRNVAVFDFIRPDAGREIFNVMLANALGKLRDAHKINLDFAEDALETIGALCLADLSMGGRGVGNAMEEYLLNPLARALFELDASQGDYRVERAELKDGAVRLALERL